MALAGQGKTKGMTAFVAFRTTCNQSLAVIQPKQIINSKFLLYFLTRNYFYIRGLAGEGKRDGLNLEIIGSLYIPLFDLEEQKAIAAFLDRKTAEIDKLIAQKERLITLYEEEKTAIINEAVTKGINPDGKLKPSGIDWLGDIPEHWELKRLRHSCSHIFLGLTGKVDYVDNLGFPLVRANNITNGYLDLSQVKFISEKQHRELTKKNKTQKNDILLTKSGSIGTAAIVDIDQEFSIYESIFTLRVKKNVAIPRFLLFFIRSEICKKQYENSIVGMGVGHLNMGDIVDVNMPIPPLEEQKVIAEYIEKETARIDAKIAKTKRIIELQTEYRTALISEAVTGKIKVPNLQGE
jgi:type I restriction enzyme S subunit